MGKRDRNRPATAWKNGVLQNLYQTLKKPIKRKTVHTLKKELCFRKIGQEATLDLKKR